MCAIADKNRPLPQAFWYLQEDFNLPSCRHCSHPRCEYHRAARYFTAAVFFYISNEGVSIMENAAHRLPVPVKLKEVLEQLHDRAERR